MKNVILSTLVAIAIALNLIGSFVAMKAYDMPYIEIAQRPFMAIGIGARSVYYFYDGFMEAWETIEPVADISA